MAKGLNKVTLIGNLGADPTINTMPSGDLVANISIATTDKWKDKQTGENREATEWHRINVYAKLAEVVQKYLSKGDRVYLEGKLHTRKYTNSDGQEKYITEIRAFEIIMLGSPQQRSESPPPPPPPQSLPDDFEDDIPF